MQELFDEMVNRRCGDALKNNRGYIEKEYSGKVSAIDLQCMAERICYIQGVRDTLNFFKEINRL